MKLQYKIFLLVFFVVLVIGSLLTLVSVRTITTNLQDEISERLSADAFHTVDKLDRFLFERISDIQFMTSELNFVLLGDLHSIEEKVAYLQEVESDRRVYASISIYDEQGIKIADTKGIGLGDDASSESFFQSAIAGEIYSSDVPVFSSDVDVYVLYFAGPLKDQEGNIIGVLVTRFPINRINDILELTQEFQLSRKGNVDLVDSQGMLLFSTREDVHVMSDVLNHPELLSEINMHPSRILVIESDLESHIHFENTGSTHASLIAAAKEQGFLDYKGKGWILIIDVSREEIFAPVRALAQQSIIIALLLIVIVTPLIYFFSRSLVNPILSLQKEAGSISLGKHVHRTTIRTKDEVGRLAKSFEHMARKVTQARNNLESQVRERTKELQSQLNQVKKLQRVTVGRELKMIELKQQIAELKRRLGEHEDET